MNTPDPIPFDTHRFVRRMTEAGMPLAQAEVLAEEQVGLIQARLATRQDTDELKLGLAEVKRDIGELERRVAKVEQGLEALRLDVAVMKTELTMVKWMMSGIGFGMLLLLVRAFWPA